MKLKTAVKWLAVLAGAGLIFWANKRYLNLSPKEIRIWVLSFGIFAPLIFIGISIVRPLVLFPVSVISIAGGLAFGPILGTLYTLFGSMCASAVSFFCSRSVCGKNQQPSRKAGKHPETDGGKRFFLYLSSADPSD